MLDWKDMCNLQQAVAVVAPKEAFVPRRELYQRPVGPISTCAIAKCRIWNRAFQISIQSTGGEKRKQVFYLFEYYMTSFFSYQVNLLID